MADSPNTTEIDFKALAENAGATFSRTASGRWAAKDADGAYAIKGALSQAEAARSFCEISGLVPPEGVTAVPLGDPGALHDAIARAIGEPVTPLTPDEIKAAVRGEYAEHSDMPEFGPAPAQVYPPPPHRL